MKFNFFTKNSIVCMAEGSLHKTFLALSVVALSLVTVACGGGGNNSNKHKGGNDGGNVEESFKVLQKTGQKCYDDNGDYSDGSATATTNSPSYVMSVGNVCFNMPDQEFLVVIPNHLGKDIVDCDIRLAGIAPGYVSGQEDILNIFTNNYEHGFTTTTPAGNALTGNVANGQYGYIYVDLQTHPIAPIAVVAICTDSAGNQHTGKKELPTDHTAVIHF